MSTRYLGHDYDTPCTILFTTFAVVFFLTRLVFLPITVIPSGYWEAMQIDPPVPGFTVMNVALVMLQALHVGVALDAAFWSVSVLRSYCVHHRV